jgi:hypothetical protein
LIQIYGQDLASLKDAGEIRNILKIFPSLLKGYVQIAIFYQVWKAVDDWKSFLSDSRSCSNDARHVQGTALIHFLNMGRTSPELDGAFEQWLEFGTLDDLLFDHRISFLLCNSAAGHGVKLKYPPCITTFPCLCENR